MKLEVGMYVRTKHYNHIHSYISKIIKITDDYVKLENQKDTNYSWEKEDIVKASYNIIDILEVGDYVNGFPVIHKENDILKCGLLVQFKENEIKSIVTHEQMEQMAYKVGE